MVKSKAAQRATLKYQQRVYDRVSVLLPKGLKEQIQTTGESLNGFIKRVIIKELESIRQDKGHDLPPDHTTDA